MPSIQTLAAPLLLLAYYVIVCFALGTDSAPKVVVPQYAPPGGLSPAYLRFIWRGVADARTVAAVFAALSSRRLISLQKNRDKYTVRRLYAQTTPLPNVPSEEHTALDFLFSNFYEETTFDPSTQSQGCASVILGKLTRTVGTRYVQNHSGYIVIGVLGSYLAATAMLFSQGAPNRFWDSLIAAGLIVAFAVFAPLMAKAVQPLIRDIRQGTWTFMRIFLALLLISFFAMWFVLVGARLHPDYSWNAINAIFAMALLNAVAQPFLRRDTEEGKNLKQEIEGFRAFLVAVEQDQLDRMNKPAQEIDYAANLAYAVALEVKEAWGDYLSNAFSQI
ncbi:MAG TPA: hypothetical protein VMT53_20665 [Terriglobales bacterium]|nr:hypothetical protein [Terriglobales bacterium]